MKSNMKILAAFVAFAMIAVAFTAVGLADSTSAEERGFPPTPQSAPYGEFNISVKFGEYGSWTTHQNVDGYNAAIAINSLSLGIPMDMNYTVFVDTGNPAYDYWTINSNYGKITIPATIGGNTYNYLLIGYYDAAVSQWKYAPTESLGFYKPFADYGLKTANIVLYFLETIPVWGSIIPPTPVGVPIKSLVPLYYNGTTGIIGNPDFKVDFGFVVDLTAPQKTHYKSLFGFEPTVNQIQVSGYGSDGYLALKNALGAAVVGKGNVLNGNAVNLSYGSVQDIDDCLYWESSSFTQFFYWSLYTVDGLNPSVYADFLLGFYSPLTEASLLNSNGFDFVVDTFDLKFVFSMW